MSSMCPNCQAPIEPGDSSSAEQEFACPSCGRSIGPDVNATLAWPVEQAGQKLGRFELLETLGAGAFGTVHRARDTELDRIVAIKVPRAGKLGASADRDRFLRESRSLAQLHHPGIVPVYEVGQADGLPFLVSEFVDGVTLADYLTGQRLSPRDGAALVAEVADALQYAHEHGVVHRDVKPSNIMLETADGTRSEVSAVARAAQPARTQDRSSTTADQQPTSASTGSTRSSASVRTAASGMRPRLMDFGLARRETGADVTVTQEGQVLGTPAYMSPEQAAGESHQVDGRSDVYSLGVIVYELLTGERPFRGNKRMLLHQVLNDEPRQPRSLNDHVPRDLETICLKCLQKSALRRYETAGALAADLRRWLSNEPILARPVGRVERLVRFCQRRPALAGLTAAVVLLLVLVAVVASVGYVQTSLALGREAIQHAEAERQREAADAAALRARTEADKAKRLLYVASMHLAEQAWENNNVVRLRQFLDETADYEDRGFEWYYLQRLGHLQLATLAGHSGPVLAVAWSNDGRRIATGSGDGTARVWDAVTGREVTNLKAHPGSVTAVAFSPDARTLATSSDDGTARVWDVATGRRLATFAGHTSHVHALAFSADGKRIISGSRDRSARIWAAASGKEELLLKGHEGAITSVAFFPDDQRVATAGADGTLRVWDAADGHETLSVKPADGVAFFALSQNGERLLTVGSDSMPRLWDSSTGQEVTTLRAHPWQVTALASSVDGKRIVTCYRDNTARVWDVASGQELLILKSHTQVIAAVAFSPDGNRIVTGSVDGTARVWDATSSRASLAFQEHTGHLSCVAISPEGKRVVTGGWDDTARVWDADTRRELHSLKGHKGRILAVAFSPNGQRVATGSWDNTARIWDLATGYELVTLQGHAEGIQGIAFSPDGARVATASNDRTAMIWDVVSGRPVLTLKRHEGAVLAVAFSADGKRLVTCSWDRTAKLWDAETGRELLTFKGHAGGVRAAAFTADGRRLVTGSWDQTAKLWDTVTGAELFTLRGHTDGVNGVAFAPGDKRVVTGSGDGTAKIWDTASGRETVTLKGHSRRIDAVAFSPDGRRIITASHDRTARVWDAASPEDVAAWSAEERATFTRREAAERASGARARAEGFIQDWLILAPIPMQAEQTGAQALDQQQLAQEASLRPKAGDRARIDGKDHVWQSYSADKELIDLTAFCGQQRSIHCVGYAVCYVVSDSPREGLKLKIGSDDQSKIYLNGKEVYRHAEPRGCIRDEDTVANIALNEGTNVLVFKIVNQEFFWEGYLRFVDQEGNPVANLEVRLWGWPPRVLIY